MRFKLSLLLIAVLAAPICASADTYSDFPLNFGSNSPLGSGGGPCVSYIRPNVCVESFSSGPISGSSATPVTQTETFTFTFGIAPGWYISDLDLLTGSLDASPIGEFGPNPPAFADWGAEFANKLTLCDANDVCYTSTATIKRGGTTLPTPTFDTHAVAAGTGVYQTFLYLDDVEVLSDAEPQANIFVSQTPEPSTLLLMGTGALGLLGCVKRRVLRS